jgi:hypothetical protein
MLWRGKKQLTGTLDSSTVRHLKTPAVHKSYSGPKYSCTIEYAWVLTKHAITSMHSALMIFSTIYHNERLTYIMRLWMLITIGQEMCP